MGLENAIEIPTETPIKTYSHLVYIKGVDDIVKTGVEIIK